MRAMANDQRLNAAKFAWAGTRNNSQSIMLWNGREVRRNLIIDPRLLTSGWLEYPSRATLSRNAGGGVTIVQTSTTNTARFDLTKTAVPLETYTISFDVTGPYSITLFTSSWASIHILATGVSGGRRWLTFKQPAGETMFNFGVPVTSLTVGTSVTIDRLLIEAAPTPKPFFSGDTTVTADTLDLLSLSLSLSLCLTKPTTQHGWGLVA